MGIDARSLAAARTGFVAANVAHDRTDRELLGTGQLAIIRDSQIRQGLGEYYRTVEALTQSLGDLPQGFRQRIIQLTGYQPRRFAVWGGDVDLEPQARFRLLQELVDDPQVVRELREIHGRLDNNRQRLARLQEQLDDLASLLE